MVTKKQSASGQALMIAVLVGLVLALCIPIIVYITQAGGKHQVGSQKRARARNIAAEGIAYATQLLSDETVWNAAVYGNLYPPDCNSATSITTPGGGHFKLICSNNPATNRGLQPYQVAVTAMAYIVGDNTPMAGLQVYLSRRTLGSDLTDGVHAAAAMQLTQQPLIISTLANPLVVQWGPMVIEAITGAPPTWTMPNPLHQVDNAFITGLGTPFTGFPRKFSQGSILPRCSDPGGTTCTGGGTNSAFTTDHKEFWAFASQTYPPLVDEDGYRVKAQGEVGISATQISGAIAQTGVGGSCPGGVAQCGYFIPSSANPVVFDNYTITPANHGPVIFVDGDAQFGSGAGGAGVDIDSATFIIMRDLYIATANGGTTHKNLHVPAYAPLDYSYWPAAGPQWPCNDPTTMIGITGTPCDPDTATNLFSPTPVNTKIHFRGFIYVKGSLIVNSNVKDWHMAGSLLVGDMRAGLPSGQLVINAGGNFTLIYDDIANHDILVNHISGNSFKLEPDVMKEVSVSN